MKRALPALAVLVAVLAGAYALLQVFEARDDSGVATSAASGPGTEVPARCAAGTGLPVRDGGRIGADELLRALEAGNVVLEGPDPQALRAAQEAVSGPYDPELAAAGLAVIVAEGDAVRARAFGREVEAASAADPALREFAEHWLGNELGAERCG